MRAWVGGLCIGLLFFFSGFTGLVYEVVWAKYLALVLGSTAYAQVGVLAVFMGGLALGGALWGRAADRTAHALRLYGRLEIGVGLSAALFAVGFDTLSHAYWSALALVDNAGPAAVLLKTLLCLAAMLPPTICMGGTLPVLNRALNVRRSAFGRGVAYLYAVNSFGAALGAVLTGFYLVPEWGFDAPFYGAAVVNIALGLLAIVLDPRFVLDESSVGGSVEAGFASLATVSGTAGAPALSTEPADVRGYRILVPAAAAISGAVAMIYEVSWIRLCSLVLGASTYSFSIMLTAFILGIAAGGLFYSVFSPAGGRPLRFFAFASILSVALVLACLPWYDRLPFYAARLAAELRQRHLSFAWFQAANLAFCVATMLPLTFVSGLAFPALAHAAAQTHVGVSRPVSYVLVANTSGTILGTVLGGLVLLPMRGLESTFLLCGGITMLTVLLVLLCDRAFPRWQLAALAIVTAIGTQAYLRFVPAWDLRLLTLGEFRRHEGLPDESFATYYNEVQQRLLYYRDGASATVSVEEWPDERILRVNGKADASAYGDRETQLLLAHIPAVLHPGARHALVIGYGSGMTVGALLRHPFESVDVVEIAPEVIATDRFFRDVNNAPLADPRTHVHIEDARTFLYRTQQRYDVVISEPSNPWIAGVSNLFTTEFFEQVQSRLSDDGVFVQWFHTYETSDRVVQLILRTVAQNFREVRAFLPNVWDIIIVASMQPRQLDMPGSRAAFVRASDLGSIDLKRLSGLLALEILPDNLTRKLAGVGDLNRDRWPILEYAAPRAFHDGATSRLLENTETVSITGYLQSADSLGLGDLRDLAVYLRRFDMVPYYNTLRFFRTWFRQAPMDPPLHEAMAGWIVARPPSPLLLSALVPIAAAVPAGERSEYVRALFQVLAKSPSGPTIEQVRTVDALARDAERTQGDLVPLQQLAFWYQEARAYDAALAVADQLVEEPRLETTQRLNAQCLRGHALESLRRAEDAHAAYAACAATTDDAVHTAALAGLQRSATDQ